MNAIYHLDEDKSNRQATILVFNHLDIKNPMKNSKLKLRLLILSIGFLGLSCEKKDIDIDLRANAWKIEKIRISGQSTYTKTDSTYILRLSGDEEYNLNLDVNTCGGPYEILLKGSIEFQAMACTEICCDSDFAEDLASLFPKMTSYYVRDNSLHFEGDGEIILLRHD